MPFTDLTEMARRARGRRGRLSQGWFAATSLATALLLTLSCGSTGGATGGSSSTANLTEWARGPARWLIQPDEQRELKEIRANSDAIRFLRDFWARRDPNPGESGNRFAEKFFIRVEAADQLYREGNVRGSLTDRGRTLIMLGPPSRMRLFKQPSLAPDPQRSPGSRLKTREVAVEEWGYELGELDHHLVDAFAEQPGRPVILRFLTNAERVKLVEGEQFLILAARAAVGAQAPGR